MTIATDTMTSGYTASGGLLDKERTIARAGFNRWLVPPAALAIHLCIGMAYGFSVFWLPLTRALGLVQTQACKDMSIVEALFTTTCEWRQPDLGWMYTLFFVVLGSAAALWGGWLERAGPRKAGVVAALCWGGGLGISAIGVATHQLWLMWLGSGVIGGIGLGLGYISPVSTLVKWFPDRRGMATGMAIMGFGGGALVGSPLAVEMMNYFRSPVGVVPVSVGVWQTFLALGAIYTLAMLAGAFGYRVPPGGWKPEGWTAPAAKGGAITARHVDLSEAHKTPQFWMIWIALCMNVSAGIGVLGIASPMLQEIFGGQLIGKPGVGFTALDAADKGRIALIGAAFVGILSLANIIGRFFWASMSDKIGRKNTYYAFFLLGIALYAATPWAASIGSKALFVTFFIVILSMYGGGFATVPAYLADVFGTQFVGAIHGRLLTAWSTAGIIGPVAFNYIRDEQQRAGVTGLDLYRYTLYISAGFLVVGLIANVLVKPLADRWFMSEERVTSLQVKPANAAAGTTGSYGIDRGGFSGGALIAWAIVGVPILWGVYVALTKSVLLFQ